VCHQSGDPARRQSLLVPVRTRTIRAEGPPWSLVPSAGRRALQCSALTGLLYRRGPALMIGSLGASARTVVELSWYTYMNGANGRAAGLRRGTAEEPSERADAVPSRTTPQ
jgi:hypothetical protein